jgi:hypothetical protein
MKEGRSIQELAIELQEQRSSMRDFKAPTNKIVHNNDGSFDLLDANGITTPDRHFGANNLFTQQLTGWADIPKKYADRMAAEAPELLSRNVNHWLQKTNETRLVRTLRGNGRAFLSHRYRVIDNIDVIQSVLPVFAEHGITSVSQEVTDNHLYIKAVNTRKTVEVKRGDKVQFGVVVSNSEVGLGAVHVDPLVYTLACLNGAIIADAGLRKFHIGRRLQELDESMEVFQDETIEADNKAFFLKLRDVVTASFDEIQMNDVLKSIEEGTKRKIGDGRFLQEVVEITSKKYGLNSMESEGILRKLIEGRDLTQWGLSSAITLYAQQVPSYERATDLEKLGGAIATLPEQEWEEIAY